MVERLERSQVNGIGMLYVVEFRGHVVKTKTEMSRRGVRVSGLKKQNVSIQKGRDRDMIVKTMSTVSVIHGSS